MTAKRNSLITLLIFVLFIVLSGCTKKPDETQADKTKQTENNTSSDENSLQESDDDISSVDYKVFYDELSSKGEWVEVSGKELGLVEGSTGYTQDVDNKESFFSKMFGIKTAHAEVQTDAGAYFVWRPASELAVSLAAGEPPVYKPYSNGQWIYTEDGWYFKAPTPAEEITSHYGRWTQNEQLGWVWVPGRVWSPAWVDWRENEDYVAWTPVPPHVYLTGTTLAVPPIDDENKYTIVEKKNFNEPQLYKYMYLENKNKIMIKEMKKVDGVMIVNRTVINKGPEVSIIENKSGKKIEKVKINKSDSKGNVKYTSDAITVYAPKLKKVKSEKNNEPVSKPQKTVKFNEVTSSANEMNKKEEKMQEKELKKETKEKEKEIKKEEKQNEKEIKKENKEHSKEKEQSPEKKKGDDKDMKQGKDKDKNDKGNNGDKGDKEKGKK